jgi:Ni,Fe-hydrogenase I cytochrome b subunit
MHTTLVLSPDTLNTSGIILLTIVAVEYGGWFMLRVVRGNQPATAFQQAFFRAGHAHAGVLVILSLVGQIFADAAQMSGVLAFLARNGIWAAAILMPAGFFLSVAGKGITAPNRFILLLYAGIIALFLGVVSLGIGLLTA